RAFPRQREPLLSDPLCDHVWTRQRCKGEKRQFAARSRRRRGEMRRVGFAMGCLILAVGAIALVQPTRPGDAQANTDGRLSALATTVANQGEQIASLDPRAAALEQSGSPTASAAAPTAAPTKTPKASASGGSSGTRDNPIPIGKGRTIKGGWVFKVVSVEA